jgi:CBS domain-containing protein
MAPETTVSSIIIEVVYTVRPESTAQEAASTMVEKGVGCLLVSGNQGALGMLTERDILRKVTSAGANPRRIRVREIMSFPLIGTSNDTPIGDAAKKMIENRIKRLAVMKEDGTFLGLVTMTDIVRWMANQKELSDSLVDYLKYNVP